MVEESGFPCAVHRKCTVAAVTSVTRINQYIYAFGQPGETILSAMRTPLLDSPRDKVASRLRWSTLNGPRYLVAKGAR
jgi:hypothetical protein